MHLLPSLYEKFIPLKTTEMFKIHLLISEIRGLGPGSIAAGGVPRAS